MNRLKNSFPKNLSKFTEKYLCYSLFLTLLKVRKKEKHLSAIVRHIYLKVALFWIWIGLMLAVVSRLFFHKNIARHMLRQFADNRYKYKANFLWWFLVNFRVFIVYEANYSSQFVIWSKKKNIRMMIRPKRELIARRRMKKEPTIYVT